MTKTTLRTASGESKYANKNDSTRERERDGRGDAAIVD